VRLFKFSILSVFFWFSLHYFVIVLFAFVVVSFVCGLRYSPVVCFVAFVVLLVLHYCKNSAFVSVCSIKNYLLTYSLVLCQEFG